LLFSSPFGIFPTHQTKLGLLHLYGLEHGNLHLGVVGYPQTGQMWLPAALNFFFFFLKKYNLFNLFKIFFKKRKKYILAP
jgi:hypothetical protein